MTAYTDRHRTDDPPQPEREDWYFTFGFGQRHGGRYFVVHDATGMEARALMFKTWGREWGFQYGVDEWFRDGVSQAEQYGLEEIRWEGVYPGMCADPDVCRGYSHCPRDRSCCE